MIVLVALRTSSSTAASLQGTLSLLRLGAWGGTTEVFDFVF
jgi:hypothetical protein